VGAEVPGLQFLGGAGEARQTSCRAEGPAGLQASHPADHEPERRTVAGAGGGGATDVYAGLEGLLPTGGYSAGLSRSCPVDRPTAADGATPPVDEGDDGLPRDEEAGRTRLARSESRALRRKLVEGRRPRRDEYRYAQEVPGGTGTSEAGTALTSTFRPAGCGPACPVVW